MCGVARRLEIELTSSRPDGTWTWRAAGAREPKGVLAGGVAPEGAKAGDVIRVEAEFELEGITVIAVLTPREAPRRDAERIEVIGSGRADQPGVTTQLVGRSARRPARDDRDRGRPATRERRGAVSGPESDASSARRPGRSGEGGSRRDGPPGREGQSRRDGRPQGQPARDGEHGRSGPTTREGNEGDSRPRGRATSSFRGGDNTEGRRAAPGRPRPDTDASRSRGAPRKATNRLNPSSVHRKAVIESLTPEEQPIAEELLRGGIPALRSALHLEREKAVSEGRVPPNTDELLALAERLLPRLRAATWRDRADAAVAAADTVPLRDLRSVIASADAARDDESRATATALSAALERRLAESSAAWHSELSDLVDSAKVVRALRLSARPPDPSTALDGALAGRLAEAASAAMSPEAQPDVWAAVMEAVADSPLRRNVAPTGLPASASPELRKSAHQMSGRIPGLAKLLGVTIPPPPRPASQRSAPQVHSPTPAGA